jgi:hypothetical protein
MKRFREGGNRMAQRSVPKAVLLDGAQMALSALVAGTMAFLKERDIPIKEWVSYIGEQFDGSLAELEGEEVGRVMEHLLILQVLPLGAEVISSQSTADKAEAIVTSLPSRNVMEKFGTTPRELLKGFGVTQRDFASLYAMYEPAAKAIGLSFSHRPKDGQELLTLQRGSSCRTRQARRRVKKT